MQKSILIEKFLSFTSKRLVIITPKTLSLIHCAHPIVLSPRKREIIYLFHKEVPQTLHINSHSTKDTGLENVLKNLLRYTKQTYSTQNFSKKSFRKTQTQELLYLSPGYETRIWLT